MPRLYKPFADSMLLRKAAGIGSFFSKTTKVTPLVNARSRLAKDFWKSLPVLATMVSAWDALVALLNAVLGLPLKRTLLASGLLPWNDSLISPRKSVFARISIPRLAASMSAWDSLLRSLSMALARLPTAVPRKLGFSVNSSSLVATYFLAFSLSTSAASTLSASSSSSIGLAASSNIPLNFLSW